MLILFHNIIKYKPSILSISNQFEKVKQSKYLNNFLLYLFSWKTKKEKD